MTNTLIDLNILPLETLAEMANEAAEQAEKSAKLTVTKAIDSGRYLIAAKEQVEHGQWLTWLGQNWNYNQGQASRYMTISNYAHAHNLTEAKSIREALRMIGEEKAETESSNAPRSERKTGRVEVGEPDPDPTPDSPTNCKTSKGSQLKENAGEKTPVGIPGEGSRKSLSEAYKAGEDKRPRTQAVVPELLEDDEPDIVASFLFSHTLEEVCIMWLGPDDFPSANKSAAKQLRKLADKLDPPTKFVRPDLEEVSAYFKELKAVDSDSFFDFYESKGWLVGKTSMKDWRASARKWVRENALNGKAINNGRRTTETDDPASCLGPNGRPRVERAKITYK